MDKGDQQRTAREDSNPSILTASNKLIDGLLRDLTNVILSG